MNFQNRLDLGKYDMHFNQYRRICLLVMVISLQVIFYVDLSYAGAIKAKPTHYKLTGTRDRTKYHKIVKARKIQKALGILPATEADLKRIQSEGYRKLANQLQKNKDFTRLTLEPIDSPIKPIDLKRTTGNAILIEQGKEKLHAKYINPTELYNFKKVRQREIVVSDLITRKLISIVDPKTKHVESEFEVGFQMFPTITSPKGSYNYIDIISGRDELAGYLNSSDVFIHRGDALPLDYIKVIKNSKAVYVRASNWSANQTQQQIESAIDLGIGNMKKRRLRILNGLPNTASTEELRKMKLPVNEEKGWKKLIFSVKKQIDELSVNSDEMTKARLIEELTQGTSDTIVLIAHSTEKTIHLPGGDSISFAEFEKLKRADGITPYRSIFLLTCKGGQVNQKHKSLSEVILQNGLTKTVIASDKEIDGRILTQFLGDLLVEYQDLQSIMKKYNLQQEVHNRIVFPRELVHGTEKYIPPRLS